MRHTPHTHTPHPHARRSPLPPPPHPTTARRRHCRPARTSATPRRRSFDAKLDTWRTLLSSFGLCRPHLCALLDASSKGLLLYTDAVVRADTQLITLTLTLTPTPTLTLAVALILTLTLTPALTLTLTR